MDFENATDQEIKKSKQIGRRVGAAMLAGVAAGEAPAQDTEPVTENSSTYTQEVDVKQSQEQYLEIKRQQYEQEARQERAWLIEDLKTRQTEGREMTSEEQKISGYNSINDALEGLEQIINSEVERKVDLDRQILDIENAGKIALEISQNLRSINNKISNFVETIDKAIPTNEDQTAEENLIHTEQSLLKESTTDSKLEQERLKAIEEKAEEIKNL